ncbi:MFS transporter [Sphingobium sp. JS3065]|uniref:MFS transporter n=1 Tax=Sphingobium sp. JS3065 TaxID=2970925 RepID=UPI0022643A08|nr:MFS transporter [Sphingobium sp. JS3065]UZW57042.1 MFS transporter [Sphingobium sp. JS3065]
MIVLTLGYVCAYVDRQIINLLVDPIRADLHLSDTQFSLLTGFAFVFMFSVAGIPIGAIIDRRSRRTIVVLGVLFWSVMTGLCGVAATFPQLFLARTGVGIGEATITPSAYSIISDSFPPERLGRPISFYLTGAGLGTGLSLVFGGALIGALSRFGAVDMPLLGRVAPWQMTFFVTALLGLPIVALALALREPARRGVVGEEQPSWGEVLEFIWTKRGIIPTYVAGIALLAVITFSIMSWAPAYLMRALGGSPLDVGFWLGIIMMVGLPGGLWSGALLSDWLTRRGLREPASLLYILSIGLTIPLTFGMSTAGSIGGALFWILLLLLAGNCSTGVLTAVVQGVVPNRMRGRVSVINIFFQSGAGLTFGALLPALLTDTVFAGDGTRVGQSLAITVSVVAPLGIVCMLPFRRAMARNQRSATLAAGT